MVGMMIFLVEWVRARLKPHVQSGVCNFWTCGFSRAFFSDILSGCELWVIRIINSPKLRRILVRQESAERLAYSLYVSLFVLC